MSEASEMVLGISHLPIFPLALVLLPNELLPLHIFEPRYRQMLRDISNERNFFGVSYFDQKDPLTDRPPVDSIGCVANVREVQSMPDGRSNLLSVGVIRYRLLDYIETGDAYLVAEVEFFEDETEDEFLLLPLANEVFALFERIAKAAHKLSGEQVRFPQIPQAEPQTLSYLVTAALNPEPALKYQMLATRSTIGRLETLRGMLRQAVGKLEESAEIHKISRANGHSNKKIEL